MSEENTPQYAEETPVTAQVLNQIHEEEAAKRKQQARRQYINFGILAAILLGIVLVVAVAAPVITPKLVGAIMGDNLAKAELVREAVDDVQETQPGDMPVTEDAYPPEAGSGGQEEAPAEENVTQPEAAAPTAVTHQVQAGETLYAISRQYNLTIEDLIRANNITTPNNIPVGTVLVIPQP
ncbi:MAG TPA: LysM peptidoglycan-binding domain-containing protein [Anaerolineae bacterium]|nr:LysM peptidoglycan-binding domain-containing protein [Anaerolineae bacterium]HIP71826.1 LysM peptidoglycan-binding domain-containing protein [Anaerolineae bacterium]